MASSFLRVVFFVIAFTLPAWLVSRARAATTAGRATDYKHRTDQNNAVAALPVGIYGQHPNPDTDRLHRDKAPFLSPL
jgi:hypothetical protein